MQKYFHFVEINTECLIMFARMISSEMQFLLCTQQPQKAQSIAPSTRCVSCPCISLQRNYSSVLLWLTLISVSIWRNIIRHKTTSHTPGEVRTHIQPSTSWSHYLQKTRIFLQILNYTLLSCKVWKQVLFETRKSNTEVVY